ncbi:ABC-type multidrug transport system, ATPase component [Fodinibius roseus]|uniref:ABC-type multidrug transport system, ATPase component n=1 Tax=Fodinibius roseus TaxID=1194090 RepID=A0A1M4WFJ3_9BACT|nr:ABC transporter ATP-binding protein [Fodinibius roseus]SHE79996.1 ABC-type multidrug transport system, ATPase component [Fodinibius roseus]
MNIVEVKNISKSYGKTTALDDLSFEVAGGELFGFIGPDGAGKTSLFRILTTLTKPDCGTANVLGMDVIEDYRSLRPLLGYMPGQFALYQDLSVRENMNFFASVFGTSLEENYDLVAPIYSQLEKFEDRLAGALSGGMKQKLALSCALIHKPELLVLDEPTTGVDAVSRQEFWEMLRRLNDEGITVIASTPYMDEAGQCDRVALIDEGNILQIDTPENIVRSFRKPILAVKATSMYRLIKELRGYPWTHSVQPFGEYVHYTEQREEPNIDELEAYLTDAGLSGISIKPTSPDIEDSFIALMKDNHTHG